MADIPLEGFQKVSGYSYEDIVSALQKAEIAHSVIYGPFSTHEHFRCSGIEVQVYHAPTLDAKDKAFYNKLRALEPFQGVHISDIHSANINALYEIPDGFDMSRLEGLAIEGGKAVEQTFFKIRNVARERGFSQALDG